MITTQDIEEGLSRAYVQAVAARAGVNIVYPQLDYGVDGAFNRIQIIDGRRLQSALHLDYQLKATVNWEISGEEIVYDLEAKTYNDLIRRNELNRAIPLMLILLCLPPDPAEWMEATEERLLMKKCCYWARITGVPTENTRTIRIRIPRKQLFTPEALNRLLDAVEQGVLL